MTTRTFNLGASVVEAGRRATRLLLLSALLATAAGCVSPGSRARFDAGFVASRDRDPAGYERLRALGPVYEADRSPDDTTFVGVRPFYTRTSSATNGWTVSDSLWPIALSKEAFGQRFWWVLPLAYGHDFDTAQSDSRYRCWVFPLVFFGRDLEGERYGALFPVGGTLHEFLGMDEAAFVLFPLYGQSRQKDRESHTVLWPIVAWSRGDQEHSWRVFPLYGRSVNEGRWTKQFVLWPIWTSARYEYVGDPGYGFVLFPVVGRVKTAAQESWMFVPPFFKYAHDLQGNKVVNCPWPFVQYERGRTDKTYLWPLWGHKQTGDVAASFYLWPLIWDKRTEREREVLRRFVALPLAYYESRTLKAPAPPADAPPADAVPAGEPAAAGEGEEEVVAARYFKLWPLVSYRREGEAVRLRTLDLWPLKQTPGIERTWAPFWTLYARTRVGENVENELLWGLFRKSRDGEGGSHLSVFPLFSTTRTGGEEPSRKWSVLGGLLGYEREGLRGRTRLLYFLKF